MKERPILFSATMVRAILEGRKTQTRLVVKPSPSEHWTPYSYGEVHKLRDDGEFVLRNGDPIIVGYGASNWDGDEAYACPYGQPGDRLWVRETHSVRIKPEDATDSVGRVWYAADGTDFGDRVAWKQSIHMPRWASRINLEITGIGVERLHEINVSDAIAEGYDGSIQSPVDPSIKWYSDLWESINGPGSWAANPWVWVIEFKRITPISCPKHDTGRLIGAGDIDGNGMSQRADDKAKSVVRYLHHQGHNAK